MEEIRNLLGHDATRISIDPGLRNFGISFENKKIHICIDFETFENLQKNIHKLFTEHFGLFNFVTNVVIEKQRSSCQNQRIEWFVRGLFGPYRNIDV